jgi:hypothetical protein
MHISRGQHFIVFEIRFLIGYDGIDNGGIIRGRGPIALLKILCAHVVGVAEDGIASL